MSESRPRRRAVSSVDIYVVKMPATMAPVRETIATHCSRTVPRRAVGLDRISLALATVKDKVSGIAAPAVRVCLEVWRRVRETDDGEGPSPGNHWLK